MIRTIITPHTHTVSFDIPVDYIGKELEVIAFAKDEATPEAAVIDKPVTHFASEKLLSKDWLTPEEDKAWQNL